MPISAAFLVHGSEAQFRDAFVMPLLVRLGFGVVVNNHGQREFGRDVVFGDIDRFGHFVYYGMQIKYESSISLSGSHTLVQDAEQATHNPFVHPHSGREEFISCFYVLNAGDVSEQARSNFYNTVQKRGIRDARIFDGNALLLLDKSASIARISLIRERLTGLVREVRRNRNVCAILEPSLVAFANDTGGAFPLARCRNNAAGSYLEAPFLIEDLDVDLVDQYWELVRMVNHVADSVGTPVAAGDFRKHRAEGLAPILSEMAERAGQIEKCCQTALLQISGYEPKQVAS